VEYVVENKTTSLVDVGCGDFQVSQRILARLPDTVRYTGLDVSQVVIERNNDLFARDGIAFVRCDAALDELPSGDLVLIREVLQHLSNSDIIKILRKVRQFPHVIISNTRKKGAARRNMDIASGASARAVLGSGLWLDLPPFNCHVEELLLVDHTEASYEIETVRLINDEPGVSKSSQ
jgi:SAM-dependent methyltransferase